MESPRDTRARRVELALTAEKVPDREPGDPEDRDAREPEKTDKEEFEAKQRIHVGNLTPLAAIEGAAARYS